MVAKDHIWACHRPALAGEFRSYIHVYDVQRRPAVGSMWLTLGRQRYYLLVREVASFLCRGSIFGLDRAGPVRATTGYIQVVVFWLYFARAQLSALVLTYHHLLPPPAPSLLSNEASTNCHKVLRMVAHRNGDGAGVSYSGWHHRQFAQNVLNGQHIVDLLFTLLMVRKMA